MVGQSERGDGTVYLRADGRWSGQLRVLGTDGLRKRRTVYGATQRDVQAQLKELRDREERGRLASPARLTVASYLEEWLSQVVAVRVRPSTLAAYRYNAERYLIPDLGRRRLVRLSTRDVRGYYASLKARGVGVRTVGYVHATLRAALEDAWRDELVDRNVAKLVRVPRPPRVEPEPLSVAEVRQLLAHHREQPVYPMLLTFAVLGLRRSEMLGLWWDDVDLEDGSVRVRRGLHRIEGRLQVMPTKTARSRRTVPLPRLVVDALVEHRVAQERRRVELAERWPESRFVFTSAVGTPMDPRNCTRVVQNACAAAGVRVVRLHDFRHGAVSVLLGLGVPPRTAMEIAGHSTVDMTMNVYGHVSLGDMRAALDAVGALFEGEK
jgi:integrase